MSSPSPADHHAHDLALIAAHAGGDAVGSERAAAESLIASCPDCAALARDIASIATSTRALSRPARTRDFRLSPEDARRLSGSRWRGLFGRLAAPETSWGRPLAAALTTLGLAGLLISATPVFLGGVAGGGLPTRDLAAPAEAPAASGETGAHSAANPVASAAAGAGERKSVAPSAGAAGPTAAPAPAVTAAGAASAAPAAQGVARPPTSEPGPAFEQGSSAQVAPGTSQAAIPVWVPVTAALSTFLLIAGLSIFGIRWASNRGS